MILIMDLYVHFTKMDSDTITTKDNVFFITFSMITFVNISSDRIMCVRAYVIFTGSIHCFDYYTQNMIHDEKRP